MKIEPANIDDIYFVAQLSSDAGIFDDTFDNSFE